MAGVLEVVHDDTKPTLIQLQESGEVMDITDFTIACRVGGESPITGEIVDATNGEASLLFSALEAGTYAVEIVVTDADDQIQTSEVFTLRVRTAL